MRKSRSYVLGVGHVLCQEVCGQADVTDTPTLDYDGALNDDDRNVELELTRLCTQEVESDRRG